MGEKQSVLEIKSVSKNYAKVEAVRGVSLEVNSGDLYALIGPNGSGKTTLIKMVVGLLRIDAGEIAVMGNQVRSNDVEAKREIGYVPDKPEGYHYLTGVEFLRLTARLRGMKEDEAKKRINELVGLFSIGEILKGRMDGYSRGNLQKTAFLAALLTKPKLLVIDEPIVGLDPVSIKVFGETLVKFTKDGGAVFFATHTLDFADKYATRVGVMKMGKLIEEGRVSSKTAVEKMYEKAL